MKGDILMISDKHRNAARQSLGFILPLIKESSKKFVITVAGESGAGKSETAASIAGELNRLNINTIVFQQDDYFIYPPKTNALKRREDLQWVGIQEVKLDLLDEHARLFSSGAESIIKPLVIFNEDRIDNEVVRVIDFQGLVIEGTYTTLLSNAHIRIFIDLDFNATKASRQLRNREEQDEYLEKILEIEHRIITEHKRLADIIITEKFDVTKNESR
jgi:uridine kinase